MIQITLKNGSYVAWNEDQYTDYMYDGKAFIIIKGSKWIGIYNMDCVSNIAIDR